MSAPLASERDFTLRDGERVIRFGPGVAGEAQQLLAATGFERYALLSTERALGAGPGAELVETAAAVLHVPPGSVPEAAAAVRGEVAGRPLVAFGGGRVIDTAKALGGADGLPVAAIPTTLSGAPFTPFHRMPAGVEEFRFVRPALAVCDPALMASIELPHLAATAMNALAHATEALYAPGANPVATVVGLRAAELIVAALSTEEPAREELALGALLGGWAIGVTGLWVHHAVCQTIVRTAGTPHAETNAVMLPHSLRFMGPRAAAPLARLAEILAARDGDVAEPVARVAARAGVTQLSELGVDAGALPAIASAAAGHPVMAAAGVDAAELEPLLRAAA